MTLVHQEKNNSFWQTVQRAKDKSLFTVKPPTSVMVVAGILKKILPVAAIGIAVFAIANIVARPAQASQSATALSETLTAFGGGVGSIGTGVQSLFTGIGTGSAQLLNPLFTLKDLIYGNDTSNIIATENALTASNTVTVDPVVNTASDQPGVTPQAPATSSAFPNNKLSRIQAANDARFPAARVATSSEKSTLSQLTGGLLG